jgi:hypothetical protein
MERAIDPLSRKRKDRTFERKREYFEWSKKVIDQFRGATPRLERRFDQLYLKRPQGCGNHNS